MSKKKETKEKMKKRIWLMILGIIVILVNAYTIYNLLLLGPIEEIIRYIIIGGLLLVDVLFLFKIRKKRKQPEQKVKLLTTLLIFYLIFNIAISGIIIVLYGSVRSVNQTYVTYSSSLVTMKNSKIATIKDVKELKIGIMKDKSSPDGYIIPQLIIKENKLKDSNNTFKSYDDYNTMMADLYSGDIDALFITTDYAPIFNSIETYEHISDETKIIITKEKKLLKSSTSNRETASNGKSITEPFTILLMGVDSTDEGLSKNTIANGDSLILITFNPKTLNATMISIPRDSYVPIACWAGKPENKITHAAAYGTDCMMQTIEEYFDVTIDYYAKINFRGLVSLVDTLGGINVEVPQDLCTDNSNREGQVCITEGPQTLTGEQALVLARNRKQLANGDLDRGLNQQIVIEGIINKVKDMKSINQVKGVLDTITNNLDTNFTPKQILSFYDIAKDIMTNSLQKDDSSLVNIEQLFLTGTGQMIYDERSRLVLWDYVPNPNSQKDITNAMKVNLGQKNPTMIKKFAFSIDEVYEKKITGTGPYKTAFSYTLLPDFTGDSQATAQSWANRNGVRVSFTGGSGTVIRQSLPAGKRKDLISGSVVLTLSGGTTNHNNSNNNSNSSSNNQNSNNSNNTNKPSNGGNTETDPDKGEEEKDPDKEPDPITPAPTPPNGGDTSGVPTE